MKKWTTAALVIPGVYLLDQVTKYIVQARIAPGDSVHVLPVLDLVHMHNTGAAFSMGVTLGNGFFITMASVAILVISYMLVKGMEHPLSLSLILGGAAGNLTDRIRIGSVHDFLYFHIGNHYWPAFNVADSALTVGVGLIIVMALRRK